jgi:hypothetical protein
MPRNVILGQPKPVGVILLYAEKLMLEKGEKKRYDGRLEFVT